VRELERAAGEMQGGTATQWGHALQLQVKAEEGVDRPPLWIAMME
jgi:hypothetical protein